MPADHDRYRKAKDVGSKSPSSEEAKWQGMAGDRGAQASRTAGTQSQPAQASNRRPEGHHQKPEQRKSFEPGQAPSEQGEKDHPSPHVIARHQQGFKSRSGSHGAHTDHSEEEAVRGEPHDSHERHGRQHVPGNRPGHRS